VSYYGPFYRLRQLTPGQSSDEQWVYKSTDRSKPIPYQRAQNSSSANWNWGRLDLINTLSVPWSNLLNSSNPVYAQAYDRLYGQVGARAQNLMNLMEVENSFLMIANRASQLGRAIKQLRNGDVIGASKTVGYKHGASPREVRTVKRALADSFSSGWLEFTFGWLPVVQDIGASVDILQREFPTNRIKGSGKRNVPFYRHDGGQDIIGDYAERVHLSARLLVTNPNVLLANQMGFLNPQAVAWDAVPFSFVVDWFLPVGKFLNSMSNDYGVSLVDIAINGSISGASAGWHTADTPNGGSARAFWFIRNSASSLPVPDLLSRARFPAPSHWLAATSVSLLTQQLLNRR
jgi:hypothetical protein